MGKYVFKKLFTAAWVALLFTFCHLAAAATNVSVTATPSNPTAPATVTLAASGDSDGNPIMVTKVEYFNGTASLGVSVQSPFTLALDNLAAGTYQIIAKVTTTDPVNPVLQSAPVTVTVGNPPGAATAYFIHTDQLNAPRAITNGSGDLVWQWDSDPFGKETPNEQPSGQSAFIFNPRFPGQQFDRESNLHYNYFRDYDPALGRYLQSDPIGLRGGINTFSYSQNEPLKYSDPTGLTPAIAGACFVPGVGWVSCGVVATGAVITCGLTEGCRRVVRNAAASAAKSAASACHSAGKAGCEALCRTRFEASLMICMARYDGAEFDACVATAEAIYEACSRSCDD